MDQDSQIDHTTRLRSLMEQSNISSFRALSRSAGVSDWQINQLRSGKIAQMRVDVLMKIGDALHLPLIPLLSQFLSQIQLPEYESEYESEVVIDLESGAIAPSEPQTIQSIQPVESIHAIRHEYQRLQAQFETRRESLWQEFQQSSLDILESWLLQWPTAAHAAQNNPQIPASRLLPLMRPVEDLIRQWGVEAIAPVGAEIPYDPHRHQLMEGHASPGDLVRVRYVGYYQGDRLLYRAKVSPLS
ncbi:MAG: helix-turn-helix domain-containing protein [Elainellaceae cyanobacterium]